MLFSLKSEVRDLLCSSLSVRIKIQTGQSQNHLNKMFTKWRSTSKQLKCSWRFNWFLDPGFNFKKTSYSHAECHFCNFGNVVHFMHICMIRLGPTFFDYLLEWKEFFLTVVCFKKPSIKCKTVPGVLIISRCKRFRHFWSYPPLATGAFLIVTLSTKSWLIQVKSWACE